MASEAGELRLAVVMNGGVSLAVWMGGVAHELDLLRRASAADADADAVPEYDRAVFDGWREAAREQDVGSVVVDVIAGTSAGGLNGALLATAAARGASLDPPSADASEGPFLRRVWEREAALEQGHLLRDGSSNGSLPTSVLDGGYFETMIDSVLGGIRTPEGTPQPVTLFLTATAVGSAEQRYVDAYDRPFLVADHRRLYRFRSDPHRYAYRTDAQLSDDERFDLAALREFDDHAPDLSKAARASASFPGAFAAVRELETMAGPPVRVLPKRAGPPAWLIDGGVLDNAPFGPVLDSIARRPVNGPVRRVLMYVVPTRGTPPAPTADGTATGTGTAGDEPPPEPLDEPPVVQLAAAGFTYPREVDFRDDVDRLDELLRSGDASEPENVATFARVLADPARRDQLFASADGLLDIYRRGRALGVVAELRAAATPPADQPQVHRLAAVDDEPPERVLAAGPEWLDATLASVASLGTDPWRWGTAPAERCVRLMVRELRTRGGARPTPELRSAVTTVSEHLSQIEAVRDALQAAMAATPSQDGTTVGESVELMNGLLRQFAVPRVVGGLVSAAAEVYATTLGTAVAPEDVVRSAFCVEVLSRALRAREPYHRAAGFEFLRVGPDVEMPAVGISTDRALRVGDTKLYGLRAGHFAAFGKREWRRWDWLCGRLDAVTHLGRMLGLSNDRIADLQTAVLASEQVTAEEVADQLGILAATTNLELLRQLHAEPAGRAAMERLADEVFGVAAGIRDPRFLGRVGRTAAVLGRTTPLPGMGMWERAGRLLLSRRVRRRMWSWTKG